MTGSSLGVIVGRFQVDKLHHGHHHLITTVADANDCLLIVLGSGQGLPCSRYPLSFEARAKMIIEAYPKAIVHELYDQPNNYIWSQKLDELIRNVAKDYADVKLYGSRDSFIPAYMGKYPTITISPYMDYSATARRERIGNNVRRSKAWRQGVIYAMQNRLPITYNTVDIAVLRDDQVLLGEKKSDDGFLRFIGGFVDDSDISDECAARRELQEEAGKFEIGKLQYIASSRINDWRYKGSKDGIMTRFFVAKYLFGRPQPGDDIDALHWVPITMFQRRLTSAHSHLGELLMDFIKQNHNL
jgi:bifunctional NMN adenylyltransferase/nudix hydrolase